MMRPNLEDHSTLSYCRYLYVAVLFMVQSGSAAAGCYKDHQTTNVALGKTTYSSTPVKPSALTTDGDRAEYDAICMDTVIEENPWLVVDLQEPVPISTVVLTAFTPYQAIYWYQVFVGHTFDAATFDPVTSGYVSCVSYNLGKTELEVLYIHCEKTLVGRYVLIYGLHRSNLRVCEVEVYTTQVFQPEKWTCIRPGLQGPKGLLNLAQGKDTAQSSVKNEGYSYKLVDGNDEPHYERGESCTHHAQDEPSWWAGSLGKSSVVTGVVITNRNIDGVGFPQKNFKILVIDGATQTVDIDMCAHQPPGRKYYKVQPAVKGDIVSIFSDTWFTFCEVEVYSDDVNDLTFQVWTNNISLPNQAPLYDDDDTTCVIFNQSPTYIEIPWDPTAQNGMAEHTSNYYCKQNLYVNVSHTAGVEPGVSVSKDQVVLTSAGSWLYQGKYCDVIGTMDHNGLTRVRYACFCEVKCWVFISVKHVSNMNVADSRLCTINVYD